MLGIAGVSASASIAERYQPVPAVIPPDDEQSPETTADLGLETIDVDGCQRPTFIANTPTERAAVYASQVVEWLAGQDLTWAEIQIDYRRFAKEQKWRLELADRILSKALKDAGCTRTQEDRRNVGGGRPIIITIPWRDE